MSDKSIEGIRREVSKGLAVAAFYFFTTHAMPIEMFEELIEERLPTGVHTLEFYMVFRNEHPELFI